MSELQNANDIAPFPSEDDFADENNRSGLAAKMAANHAARAWAWRQTYLTDISAHRNEGMLMLQEYELATVWWLLANEEHLTSPDGMATEVLTDLYAPHVHGPNLHMFLREAGVDPQEIEPYVLDNWRGRDRNSSNPAADDPSERRARIGRAVQEALDSCDDQGLTAADDIGEVVEAELRGAGLVVVSKAASDTIPADWRKLAGLPPKEANHGD